MVKSCASSVKWIHMGGPDMGFSGASRWSSFVTNRSANSLRKYALAASGDVVLNQWKWWHCDLGWESFGTCMFAVLYASLWSDAR